MNYRLFILCIGGWYFTSITLAIYNKWMFSPIGHGLGVEFPILLTSIHQLTLWLLSYIYIKIRDRRKYYESLTFQENNIQLHTFNKIDSNSIISKNNYNNNTSSSNNSSNNNLISHRDSRKPKSTWNFYFKFILPTAIATAGDIGLSNLSFKFIPLTIYTIIKSSSIAFVLLFSCMFKLEKFRWRLTGIVSIMFVGVIMMVYKPSHKHVDNNDIDEDEETRKLLIGSFLVLSSSCLSGLRWVYTQLILRKHDENHAYEQLMISNDTNNENLLLDNNGNSDLENQSTSDLTRSDSNDHSNRTYNGSSSNSMNNEIKKPHPIYTINQLAPIMFLTLFITSLFLEKSIPNFIDSNLFKLLDHQKENGNDNGIANGDTTVLSILYGIVLMLIPGIMVFAMTISEFGILQITKVLTLSIAGIVKEFLTIIFGIIILNERISGFYNVMGMTIVLSDVCYYNYYRYKENVKKHSTENNSIGDSWNDEHNHDSNNDNNNDDEADGDDDTTYIGGIGNNKKTSSPKKNSAEKNDFKNNYYVSASNEIDSNDDKEIEAEEEEEEEEELINEDSSASRLNSVEMEIICRDDPTNHIETNNNIKTGKIMDDLKHNFFPNGSNKDINDAKFNEVENEKENIDKYDPKKKNRNKNTSRNTQGKANESTKSQTEIKRNELNNLGAETYGILADQTVQEYQRNKLGNKFNKSL